MFTFNLSVTSDNVVQSNLKFYSTALMLTFMDFRKSYYMFFGIVFPLIIVGIYDWVCKNRACGHTKFHQYSKISSAITFNPSLYGYKHFKACSQVVWHCNTSYRMKNFIIYSSKWLWLVKQKDILCAHMPGFCRPSHIYMLGNTGKTYFPLQLLLFFQITIYGWFFNESFQPK